MAKLSLCLIFLLLKYGTFLGLLPGKPAFFNLFLIVRLVTGAFNSFFRSVEEKNGFFLHSRINNLSNRGVVFRFLPLVSTLGLEWIAVNTF